MSDPATPHHAGALLETARLELDRVHRAALATDAGELRRGLDLAIAALEKVVDAGLDAPTTEAVTAACSSLQHARADLEGGALVEMMHLIETARSSLAAL